MSLASSILAHRSRTSSSLSLSLSLESTHPSTCIPKPDFFVFASSVVDGTELLSAFPASFVGLPASFAGLALVAGERFFAVPPSVEPLVSSSSGGNSVQRWLNSRNFAWKSFPTPDDFNDSVDGLLLGVVVMAVVVPPADRDLLGDLFIGCATGFAVAAAVDCDGELDVLVVGVEGVTDGDVVVTMLPPAGDVAVAPPGGDTVPGVVAVVAVTGDDSVEAAAVVVAVGAAVAAAVDADAAAATAVAMLEPRGDFGFGFGLSFRGFVLPPSGCTPRCSSNMFLSCGSVSVSSSSGSAYSSRLNESSTPEM